MKNQTKHTARGAALAFLIGVFAPEAMAQEITLIAPDGSVNLTGELLGYENGTYKVQSALGPFEVSADVVDCVGANCPQVSFADLSPVTWNVSLWGSRRAFTEHVEKLSELVASKTDGQFRLNISYGGLSPSRENLDGLSRGAFEMAQFCAGYHPDKNPTITVLELPFLGTASMEQERQVSQAIYAHPAVTEDFARWNATLLMPTPQPQYNIAGIGSPPTSLAAFGAMTIRATGGTSVAVQALGAESVNLPAPDVQPALGRGDINAVAFAPHAHMAFNTIDSVSWWTTNLNPGTANCPVAVSTEALETLPSLSRDALLSSVDEALDHFIENYENNTLSAWDETLQERAIMKLTFSDDILQGINQEVAAPTAAAWIEKNAAVGIPAQELYNLVLQSLSNSAGSASNN